MSTLSKVLLGVAVILYGLSLVLPNRIFDINVEANAKYAPCQKAFTRGVACSHPVEGLGMQCWTPRSLHPEYQVMSEADVGNFCGQKWDTPVMLVEDGFSNTGILGGGIALIAGVIGAVALAFKRGKHEGVAMLVAGLGVLLIVTFDNSKKVMDADGLHILRGGHAAIGYYCLETAIVALFLYIVFDSIASHKSAAQGASKKRI